jgi:hypothetical protein
MPTPRYVFSTITTPVTIVEYTPYVPNSIPSVVRKFTIQGGANCPDKFMRTPRGIATPITPADYEFLIHNDMFLEHMAGGFVQFGHSENDVERAARDMTPKDRSAPKTTADYRDLPNNTEGRGIRTGRSVEEIARPG